MSAYNARVNDIAPAIVTMLNNNNVSTVYARCIVAQAIQESSGSYGVGWSQLANTYNNFFGMTAGASWTGKTVTYGNYTYRAYDSRVEGFQGYYDFIAVSSYFKGLFETGGTAEAYFNWLQGGNPTGVSWAEDPNYKSKCIRIYNAIADDYNWDNPPGSDILWLILAKGAKKRKWK